MFGDQDQNNCLFSTFFVKVLNYSLLRSLGIVPLENVQISFCATSPTDDNEIMTSQSGFDGVICAGVGDFLAFTFEL